MELNQKEFLKKFKVKPLTENDKAVIIADEIYKATKLNFGRIRKLIKEQGIRAIMENWEETKKSGSKNLTALFLWKCKQSKTIWHD